VRTCRSGTEAKPEIQILSARVGRGGQGSVVGGLHSKTINFRLTQDIALQRIRPVSPLGALSLPPLVDRPPSHSTQQRSKSLPRTMASTWPSVAISGWALRTARRRPPRTEHRGSGARGSARKVAADSRAGIVDCPRGPLRRCLRFGWASAFRRSRARKSSLLLHGRWRTCAGSAFASTVPPLYVPRLYGGNDFRLGTQPLTDETCLESCQESIGSRFGSRFEQDCTSPEHQAADEGRVQPLHDHRRPCSEPACQWSTQLSMPRQKIFGSPFVSWNFHDQGENPLK